MNTIFKAIKEALETDGLTFNELKIQSINLHKLKK